MWVVDEGCDEVDAGIEDSVESTEAFDDDDFCLLDDVSCFNDDDHHEEGNGTEYD